MTLTSERMMEKMKKYKQDVWRPLAFVSGERDTNKTYFRPNIVWQGMKLHLP